MAKLKLSYPVFRHAAAVTCGSGSLRSLPADAASAGSVFLTSAHEGVCAALDSVLAGYDGGLNADNHLRKPAGEPTAESVRDAGNWIAQRRPCRLIVVGGGSVLDWARLAWASGAGRLDLDRGGMKPASGDWPRPEIWLVPTTCGTGAEAADVAVYQSGARKVPVVTPEFMADRVVLDGNLLQGLSEAARAGFVCDALSHALEAILSLVPMRLGKQAGASALGVLLDAWASEETPSRRDALLEGSFLGGVAAANCSVGIVHAFAHAIGPDGIGHGLANACGLLDGLRFNAETAQMRSLLALSAYSSLDALEDALRPVVSAALSGLPDTSPCLRLSDPGYRREIAERMLADVAIRSNPRRPADQAEVEAWLEAVHRRAATR